MTTVHAEMHGMGPQVFFLTPRALEQFGDVRKRAPDAFEQARAWLVEAQNKLFVPYLTQTGPQNLAFEFERRAYEFIPYRVCAFISLLKVLGAVEFQMRYFSTLSKLLSGFATSAPQWGLSAEAVEKAFNMYFASAVKLIAVAQSGKEIEPDRMGEILKSITKADFGMTALFLVFDESVATERWVVSKTFEGTSHELARYEGLVTDIWAKLGLKTPIGGSLQVEGDLDDALRNFNVALSSLFSAPKPQ